MQSEKGIYQDAPSGDDPSQVHAEFSAVQFDERLLPIYEEHQRHKMTLDLKQQEDDTRIALQLMADTFSITRRGQLIGGSIAICALVGGLILVALDKDTAGAAVLVLDAVFVFSQKLVRPRDQDFAPGPKD